MRFAIAFIIFVYYSASILAMEYVDKEKDKNILSYFSSCIMSCFIAIPLIMFFVALPVIIINKIFNIDIWSWLDTLKLF